MRPLLSAQTDDRLVALTRAGNERAFEAIVHRYRAPLVRYAGRFLPSSRAEDAVQQAFMNAYEALGRSHAAIDLKPWLYRITHNAALNLLRQNGWDYDEIPPDFDGVMRPDQAAELGERLRSTLAAVKRLPERQRDAIILRELEGRTYEEIATALGTGDSAVRQLLNRARSGVRSAATAITPWPLVARAAASPSGANVERATEVAGAAGLVKVGVATLATAAVVGGTVAGPITDGGDPRAPRGAEAVAAPAGERETETVEARTETAPEAPRETTREAQRETAPARPDDRRGRTRTRGRHRGSDDRSGPGDGDQEVEDNSGPGSDSEQEEAPEPVIREDNSGPGNAEDDPAEDNSGSDSSSSGPGSGDDDLVPTTDTEVRTDNSGPGSIDDGD